ncbi:MAG: twin-arginine translocation signal domain-containing protein [Verrucomicrobia bacterium]|nr:twin-arginine translocation signal domain-containing protein [Verrucomicrobiota bacterium]MBI3868604.1 twin-arginine translocation signal domain-containing protein [Verrucomicrobiota bacterium]
MTARLFPVRQSRRDFLKQGSLLAAATAFSSSVARANRISVRIGAGEHTYEWAQGWGVLPSGMKFGYGCGIAVDAHDRVYVLTRANPAVVVFDREGRILETWSNFPGNVGYTSEQVVATAHGLYWSKERGREYLYWTENVAKDKSGARIGCRVYKTDLRGNVLFTLGNVEKEGPTSKKFQFDNPTDVAVGGNGDIFIVDGYGSQLVHKFSNDYRHIKTIGGRGKEDGKFNTCHGVWVSTLNKTPEVYIADRHNDRLQVFTPDLELKRVLKGDVRNPCCFYQHKGKLFIPDLASRVTILDSKDQALAQLGDGQGMTDNKTNPAVFAAPHALCVDSKGAFYVVEWVDFGRVRKFSHAPQKA